MAWHRWREPLAVLLLVALALMLAIRLIALGPAIQSDAMIGALGGMPGGDELLLLAAAGAVLWCATPVSLQQGEPSTQSPHARALAIAGVLIVGLTVLGWSALSVWAVIQLVQWPTPDTGSVLFVVEGVVRLAIPAVALGMVVLAVGRTGAARSHRTARVRELPATTPAQLESATGDENPPADAERLPAAWHVDDAAGAVWLTADDAAQGRPGLSWSPTAADDPRATEPVEAEFVVGESADPEPVAEEPEVAEEPDSEPRLRSSDEDDDLR